MSKVLYETDNLDGIQHIGHHVGTICRTVECRRDDKGKIIETWGICCRIHRENGTAETFSLLTREGQESARFGDYCGLGHLGARKDELIYFDTETQARKYLLELDNEGNLAKTIKELSYSLPPHMTIEAHRPAILEYLEDAWKRANRIKVRESTPKSFLLGGATFIVDCWKECAIFRRCSFLIGGFKECPKIAVKVWVDDSDEDRLEEFNRIVSTAVKAAEGREWLR